MSGGWVGRLLALVIAVTCAAAIYAIHRSGTGGSATLESTGNPDLDACLAERVGAVDRMRADGVVSAGQYEQFRARARAFCESSFGG